MSDSEFPLAVTKSSQAQPHQRPLLDLPAKPVFMRLAEALKSLGRNLAAFICKNMQNNGVKIKGWGELRYACLGLVVFIGIVILIFTGGQNDYT